MTQSEAREKLSRTIANTLGPRIILLRVAVAILLAGDVADSEAGKELTKVSSKTTGERFSIDKGLAERVLKAIPLDEAGSVDTSSTAPVEKPAAATKTRPPKDKPAKNKPGKDEPPPAEDLDEGSKPEGAADVL